MRILVDENIPRSTVKQLSEAGHDVKDIRGTGDEGITDDKVWQIAVKEKRTLITTDKWFGTINTHEHYGVLMIVLKHPNRERIHSRALLGIQRFDQKQWIRTILIMRDTVQSLRKVYG
ncbi:MAG: DUF5615 family PIN-like protein [Chitinivibrionales bacterium]